MIQLPKSNDKYWYISRNNKGILGVRYSSGSGSDEASISDWESGNYYKTRDDARYVLKAKKHVIRFENN